MATTSNYSWTTPDDTDLVKDGASAIRTLGSAIDTTVFNNAGAAVAKSTVDAKGDLIVGTANDTVGRLAVGTDGYTLVADSSTATGLAYAAPAASGGMTLLDTVSLSGASVTSATFSSAFDELVIYMKGVYGTVAADFRLRFNTDTGNNYAWLFINNAIEAAASTGTSYMRIGNVGTNTPELENSNQIINLMRPSDTDQVFITVAGQQKTSVMENFHCTGVYNNSAAITSITFLPGSGSMSAGTAYIYGVN